MVQDRIRAIAQAIADGDRETLVIVRPDGTELLRRTGGPHRVAFDDIPAEQLRGMVFIHNHPGGSSFSIQDVQIVILYRLDGIYAVTTDTIYSLRIPSDVEWDDVKGVILDEFRRLGREDLIRQNLEGIALDELVRTRHHRLWREIVEIWGWQYQVEPL